MEQKFRKKKKERRKKKVKKEKRKEGKKKKKKILNEPDHDTQAPAHLDGTPNKTKPSRCGSEQCPKRPVRERERERKGERVRRGRKGLKKDKA